MKIIESYNGLFLMMYQEPTAAPMSTRINIGIKTAAVLFPDADNTCPKNFSQFLPLKSGKQSH